METEASLLKHILVVDDDPTTRRFFGSLLARAGFEVLYAKDGNDGREMAKRLRPDLILLDYNMPIMNGVETAERIKGDPDPTIVSIPIALLTNEDLSIEDQRAIKDIGVVDYMQKGLSNEEFVARVKKLMISTTKPDGVK